MDGKTKASYKDVQTVVTIQRDSLQESYIENKMGERKNAAMKSSQ